MYQQSSEYYFKILKTIQNVRISFEILQQNFIENNSNYNTIIQELTDNLISISKLIEKINDTNIREIKTIVKKISELSKKELYSPLTSNKNDITKLEKTLMTVKNEIESYYTNKSPKQPKHFSEKEYINLNNYTIELSIKIKNYQDAINLLFEKFYKIQESLNDNKKIVNQFTYTKEEGKIIKKLLNFTAIIQENNYIVVNKDLLLETLDSLKNSISYNNCVYYTGETIEAKATSVENPNISDNPKVLLRQFKSNIKTNYSTEKEAPDENLDLNTKEDLKDSVVSVNLGFKL